MTVPVVLFELLFVFLLGITVFSPKKYRPSKVASDSHTFSLRPPFPCLANSRGKKVTPSALSNLLPHFFFSCRKFFLSQMGRDYFHRFFPFSKSRRGRLVPSALPPRADKKFFFIEKISAPVLRGRPPLLPMGAEVLCDCPPPKTTVLAFPLHGRFVLLTKQLSECLRDSPRSFAPPFFFFF